MTKKTFEEYSEMSIDDAIEDGMVLNDVLSEHIRNFALLMEADYRGRGLSGKELYTKLLNDPKECIKLLRDTITKIEREMRARPVMSQAEHDRIGSMWLNVAFIAMHANIHHYDPAVQKLTVVRKSN